MSIKKTYFPNLDGIRFIAAALVIVHHIEQLKSIFGHNSYWESIGFVRIAGKLGVVMFFVLSGFLITYLLLNEEKEHKSISIKMFYLRRVLRIWPLYFLIILLAFLVLPNISAFTLPGYGKEMIYQDLSFKMMLFLLLFPNLALVIWGGIPYAAQTWSIGTEEQYYGIWPIMMKIFKKNRIYIMILILLFYKIVGYLLGFEFLSFPYKEIFVKYWSTLFLNSLAIGGLFAALLFYKNKILKYILNTYLFNSSIILVIILICTGKMFPFMHYEIYSFLFAIIILNFSSNPKISISLEGSIMNYLGRISYGLYMFHGIAIVLSIIILNEFNLVNNWLLYPLSFIFTILIAGISYKYYESFFIRYKPYKTSKK